MGGGGYASTTEWREKFVFTYTEKKMLFRNKTIQNADTLYGCIKKVKNHIYDEMSWIQETACHMLPFLKIPLKGESMERAEE